MGSALNWHLFRVVFRQRLFINVKRGQFRLRFLDGSFAAVIFFIHDWRCEREGPTSWDTNHFDLQIAQRIMNSYVTNCGIEQRRGNVAQRPMPPREIGTGFKEAMRPGSVVVCQNMILSVRYASLRSVHRALAWPVAGIATLILV